MRQRILLTFFILLFGFALYAQEGNDSITPGYFIDNTGEQLRFVQRLVWEKDEYAFNYGITIQIFDNGYRDYISRTTENNHLDVSLPPGRYRYSVTTYDLLGRSGYSSDWSVFNVIAAYQPVLERFIPASFNMDQRTARELLITGVNIFEDTVIFLENAENTIYPKEIRRLDSQRVTLVFDDASLIEGVYDICIQNPGGLETRISGFSIGYRKPLDFFFKAALTPVAPMFGELADEFGQALFLRGASLSLEAVSSRRGGINGGVEFAASVYVINPDTPFCLCIACLINDYDNVSSLAIISDFSLNIAIQRRFNHRRNAFTLRVGCGVTSVSSEGYDFEASTFPHLNFGLSFLALIINPLFFEIGVDYTYYVTDNPFGLLKPRLGFAIQF